MFRERQLSDKGVIERVLAGRTEAFGVLVERYLQVVQAVAYSKVANRTDAEDIAQETFLRSLQSLPNLRDPERFGSWLVGITRNVAGSAMRNNSSRANLHQAFSHSPSPDPIQTLERNEMHELLRAQVMALEQGPREILFLHYFAGKTVGEAAGLLNITTEAAKKRLQRARDLLCANVMDELGEALKPEGPSPKRAVEIMAALVTAPLAWEASATATATAGWSAGGLATLGGIFVMKKVVVGIAVVLVVAIGLRTLTQRNQLEPAGRSGPAKEIHLAEETSVAPAPLAAADETASAGLSKSVSEPAPEPEAAPPVKGRVLSGRVEDNHGAPVTDATVVFAGGFGSISAYETIQSATDGTFEFTSVPPIRQIWVTARKQGLAAHVGPLDLAVAGLTDVVVTMYPEAEISGKVVDDYGTPLANVPLFAEFDPDSPEFKGQGAMAPAHAESDADGDFILSGVPAGSYRFVVDYQPAFFWGEEGRAVLSLKAGEHVRNVVFTIAQRELTISGHIHDTTGRPVEDAEVEYEAGRITRAVRTDETGYYETILLTERRTSLRVSHPMYRKAHRQPVFPGSANVDFVLEAYGAVSGRVVDAQTGKAVPVFEITSAGGFIKEITALTLIRTGKVDNEEGLFHIADVVPGDVTLVVRKSDYAIAMQPVFVPPGEGVEGIVIRLQPAASIKGVVTDVSGKAIADARVFYGTVPHESWHTKYSAAVTGANGVFALDSIAATGQLLSAYHRDYAVGSTLVKAGPDDARAVAIVLEQGGAVEGLITMDGEPLANGEVSVSNSEYFYSPHHYGKTNQDGQYSLSHLTPGEVRVLLTTRYGEDGSGWRRLERAAILEDGKTTVVDFDASRYYGILEGTVSVGGEGTMGAIVVAHTEANGLVEMYRSITGQDGRYRLEELPPGPVDLEVIATPGDGQRVEGAVTVRISEDEVVRQDIDLQH